MEMRVDSIYWLSISFYECKIFFKALFVLLATHCLSFYTYGWWLSLINIILCLLILMWNHEMLNEYYDVIFNIKVHFLFLSRMNSTLLLRPSCLMSSLSPTHGLTSKLPKENTSRNMKNACQWRRREGLKKNYRYTILLSLCHTY